MLLCVFVILINLLIKNNYHILPATVETMIGLLVLGEWVTIRTTRTIRNRVVRVVCHLASITLISSNVAGIPQKWKYSITACGSFQKLDSHSSQTSSPSTGFFSQMIHNSSCVLSVILGGFPPLERSRCKLLFLNHHRQIHILC